MNLQLGNQVVFVAGSSRGIGRAIAAALLAEGANVVLTGRDEASLRVTEQALNSQYGESQILAIAGDFTQNAAIAPAMAQTIEHFGRIDHLVANLGTGSGKPGWDQPEEEWTRLFELNFFASARLAQAAIPHLMANPNGGSLLFVSSIVAVEATPAPLPYSAAKAALVNYAKNLSRQLGSQRIRVNTIAPGNILFEGGSWERHLATRPQAVQDMLSKEVPLQRFGTPSEIASLAAWLCSPLAAFATGGCFIIDGGQTRTL